MRRSLFRSGGTHGSFSKVTGAVDFLRLNTVLTLNVPRSFPPSTAAADAETGGREITRRRR
jgi:hypothetical protein